MIETRLLRQFVAVAEELHFHRAAQRLNMAQPALSLAIRKLEQAMDVRLLDRNNRKVSLTPAGASFLEVARRTLRQLDEGVDQAQRVAAGVAGRLSVAFVATASLEILPGMLRAFHHGFPNVELKLVEGTTAEQVEMLRTGGADIGLLRWPGVAVPGLVFECVARESILVALPSDHPAAAEARVRLGSLAGEGFITSPRAAGAGFHDQLVTLCRSAGFSPRIVQIARQMQTVVGLVAGGLGVALVPSSVARTRIDGVDFRPVSVDAEDAMTRLDLLIGWDGSRSVPLRDRFIDVARRCRARFDLPDVSMDAG